MELQQVVKRSQIQRYPDEKAANKAIRYMEDEGWVIRNIFPMVNPNGSQWQDTLIFVWYTTWEECDEVVESE